jgi:hypothetical protein
MVKLMKWSKTGNMLIDIRAPEEIKSWVHDWEICHIGMFPMPPHQFIISKANSLIRRVNFRFRNVHGGREMYSRVLESGPRPSSSHGIYSRISKHWRIHGERYGDVESEARSCD